MRLPLLGLVGTGALMPPAAAQAQDRTIFTYDPLGRL